MLCLMTMPWCKHRTGSLPSTRHCWGGKARPSKLGERSSDRLPVFMRERKNQWFSLILDDSLIFIDIWSFIDHSWLIFDRSKTNIWSFKPMVHWHLPIADRWGLATGSLLNLQITQWDCSGLCNILGDSPPSTRTDLPKCQKSNWRAQKIRYYWPFANILIIHKTSKQLDGHGSKSSTPKWMVSHYMTKLVGYLVPYCIFGDPFMSRFWSRDCLHQRFRQRQNSTWRSCCSIVDGYGYMRYWPTCRRSGHPFWGSRKFEQQQLPHDALWPLIRQQKPSALGDLPSSSCHLSGPCPNLFGPFRLCLAKKRQTQCVALC